MATALGQSIPGDDPHAVSVSLPLWQHMVGWGHKDEEVVRVMKTGYPRFFIPLIVRELAERLVRSTNSSSLPESESGCRSALLFPHVSMANLCARYLQPRSSDQDITIHAVGLQQGIRPVQTSKVAASPVGIHEEIYLVVFPESLSQDGKNFWMHTGFGISTRCASFWLDHLSKMGQSDRAQAHLLDLLCEQGDEAKQMIREKVAAAGGSATMTLRAQDVWLYHTGMSALFHSGQLVQACSGDESRPASMAVFGFLYVDTVKVLERVHGCPVKFYGHGSNADLDQLEADLEDSLHINGLYLEFPTNPLLRSPDLRRIWRLSRKHDFMVVLDDTVTTTANLDTIQCCDMACTSLTKMFSGGCNVMGGSLTLNPMSKHYKKLGQMLGETYVDTYFPLDAIVMAKNCIDFPERTKIASHNAESISDLLKDDPQVSEVFYPKGSPSQRYYDEFKREKGGYGYLLTARFISAHRARMFYDALDVAKGPSLGTNFTLCCAYTWLAHATELEWAAEFGVVEDLVRISVGIEKLEYLERVIRFALAACLE